VALVLELTEGLADRRAAHADPLAELFLGQTGTRRIGAFDDRAPDRLVGDVDGIAGVLLVVVPWSVAHVTRA